MSFVSFSLSLSLFLLLLCSVVVVVAVLLFSYTEGRANCHRPSYNTQLPSQMTHHQRLVCASQHRCADAETRLPWPILYSSLSLCLFQDARPISIFQTCPSATTTLLFFFSFFFFVCAQLRQKCHKRPRCAVLFVLAAESLTEEIRRYPQPAL